MKFLHTSDLHLGLRLCETRLNEDIEHALDQIASIAVRENCADVIAAGDIYDRTSPTPESVAIFDRFITKLASHKIAVMTIYGNHDSPERVAYLSALLQEKGVFFSPLYTGKLFTAVLQDEYGPVNFHLLPFLRPSVLRLTCEDFDGSTAEDAVNYALREVDFADGQRHVTVAHQFAASSSKDSVGGSEAVPYTAFAQSDYTALGHLHSPHHVGMPHIRYSGTPVKTSFAEVNDTKTVTLVELLEKGNMTITELPIVPIRDMREMRGTYEEMTSPKSRNLGSTDDYLRIILTDEEDIPDVMAKLRTIYPNLMKLSYDNTRTRANREIDGDITADRAQDSLTPESVFAELFELQNNAPASERIMEIAASLFRESKEG